MGPVKKPAEKAEEKAYESNSKSMRTIVALSMWLILLGGCIERQLPGYRFDLFDGTPYEKLADAVEDEDVEEIKEILKDKTLEVDFVEPQFGQTLLMMAVVNKRTKSVKALLECGADPNKTDERDETALTKACDYPLMLDCSTEIIKILLDHKADPNTVVNWSEPYNGSQHTTPLMRAASGKCLDHVKILLEYGADINQYTYHPGYGAITESIIQDQMHITKYLIIEKGAKIPEYCFIIENPNDSTLNDSLTVVELLMEEDYSDEPQKARLRDEIIEYLHKKGEK